VGEILLEVITVAVLVSVLQLVERSVLLIQQLPVAAEHVIVDHSGKGHLASPFVGLIRAAYRSSAAECMVAT
jgi:hypothetical protein